MFVVSLQIIYSIASMAGRLQFDNVSRLRAASAFDDIEFDQLTFFQRFEAFSLDCREVYENVSAIFALDESVAFFRVKPLDFTLHAIHSLHIRITVSLRSHTEYNIRAWQCQCAFGMAEYADGGKSYTG